MVAASPYPKTNQQSDFNSEGEKVSFIAILKGERRGKKDGLSEMVGMGHKLGCTDTNMPTGLDMTR